VAVVSEPEPSSNASELSISLGRPAFVPPAVAHAVTDRAAGVLIAMTKAIVVLALVGPACSPSAAPGPTPVDGPTVDSATVERVVDGDTVQLSIDGRSERARLIGIDAPESVSPNVPDQCYGAEASQALHDLLPPGSTVRIERDAEARDRYGRLLLYLYRSDDGLFVNQWMVTSGLADAMAIEPNTAFAVPFEAARREAEQAGTGLWGHCDGPDQPIG
jgi:micrococcal nuclease